MPNNATPRTLPMPNRCQTHGGRVHGEVADQAREPSHATGAGVWLPSAHQGVRGGWGTIAAQVRAVSAEHVRPATGGDRYVHLRGGKSRTAFNLLYSIFSYSNRNGLHKLRICQRHEHELHWLRKFFPLQTMLAYWDYTRKNITSDLAYLYKSFNIYVFLWFFCIYTRCDNVYI